MKNTLLVIFGANIILFSLAGCDTFNEGVDAFRGSFQKNIDPKWYGKSSPSTVSVTVTNIIVITNGYSPAPVK